MKKFNGKRKWVTERYLYMLDAQRMFLKQAYGIQTQWKDLHRVRLICSEAIVKELKISYKI